MTYIRPLYSFRTIVLLMICAANMCLAEVQLIQKPTDATAMVNHYGAKFSCSTSKRPVANNTAWRRYTPTGDREYVCEEGKVKDKFKDRFACKNNESSGEFSLVVLKPQTMDAGRYECTDDVSDNNNPGASDELRVLESNWACESNVNPEQVIGPTQCYEDITPDELQLSCSVKCFGEGFPEIEWRINGNPITLLHRICTRNGTKLTCNATMKGSRQIAGNISICQKGTEHCSHAQEVKILYNFENTMKTEYDVGDEVTCVANTSNQLPCSYQWLQDSVTYVSSNQTFELIVPGLYTCQAKCTMRNRICTFIAMVINASKSESNVLLIIGSIVCALLLTAVIILSYFLSRKQKQNGSAHQKNNRKKGDAASSDSENEPELKQVMISNGSAQETSNHQNGNAVTRFLKVFWSKGTHALLQRKNSDCVSSVKTELRQVTTGVTSKKKSLSGSNETNGDAVGHLDGSSHKNVMLADERQNGIDLTSSGEGTKRRQRRAERNRRTQ